MNKLKEENMHHMIEIKTIKIENSYLKKVMRDQNHALVGAAEKNNENAMKTLLAENKKLRQEHTQFPAEVGIFFDWCSLAQKDANGERTPEEQAAFQAALLSGAAPFADEAAAYRYLATYHPHALYQLQPHMAHPPTSSAE